MLRKILTLAAGFIVCMNLVSCNNGSGTDFFFGGSDSWLQELYFGDVPIQSGKTSNVPLQHTSVIRLNTSAPVTSINVANTLDFQIFLTNMDTGAYFALTEHTLSKNGELVWVGENKQNIEFRMKHPLSYFISDSGAMIDLGDPGDLFRVDVEFMTFEREDGNHVALEGDRFFILWSNWDTGIDDNDDDDLFGGSDPFFERVLIGDVPCEVGKTVNIALGDITSMRFETISPVTAQSLSQLFTFLIQIENIDSGLSFNLTDDLLSENGELVWVDFTNRTVEYRMNHPMDYINVGGQKYVLGSSGDLLRINVRNLEGAAEDGSRFKYAGDEFFVLWTESSVGLIE